MKQQVHDCPKNRFNLGTLGCFLGLMCLSLPLEAHLLNESVFFTEIPVITAASRLAQNPHTSPASITLLEQGLIKASGAQTLADILALAPGFQVFHLNSHRQGANYHGVNDQFPNQLEIMVNGRSVYIPLLSTVLWHTLGLSVEDVERVEIIRGSNAATQGSNAFLGAVNIITKSPTLEPGFRTATSFGSQNSAKVHLAYSSELDGVFFRVSASTENSDGTQRFNEALQRHLFNGEWLWAPTVKDTVKLNLGLDQGYSHIGYLYPYSRFSTEQRYLAKQTYHAHFQDITWTRTVDEHSKLHFRAYHNALDLDESRPSIANVADFYLDPSIKENRTEAASQFLSHNPSFRGYREHGRTSLADIEMALEQQFTPGLTTFSGIGLRRDTASSPVLLSSGSVSSDRVRLFNSSQWWVKPQLIANLGVMHEYQSSTLNATSARLAFNYQLTPRTSVRLGYSNSQRLPSLLERNGNYTLMVPTPLVVEQANPNLQPERSRSTELGLYHQLPLGDASIDLRIFNETISNAIAIYRLDKVGQRRNIGGWQNQGIETQVNLSISPRLAFMVNYSYLDNQVNSWEQTNQPNQRDHVFPGGRLAPRHTLSVLSRWSINDRLQLSGTYYWMDDTRRRKVIRTLGQPAYQRVDLRLAKTWHLADQHAEIALLIKNALHGSYQTFYQDHRFERSAFVQFNLAMD